MGSAQPSASSDDSASLATRLAELLQASARGDTKAFDAFYGLTIRRISGAVYRIVGSNHVEDVLSETYLQAWQQSARFDARRSNALTWLNTLARSRALDRLRIERSRHGGMAAATLEPDLDSLQSPDPGPDALMEQVQARGRLEAVITTLSSAERWVVGLAYHREMSHAQIADATAFPLGTVKSILNRCPQKLRAAMDSIAGAPPRPQPA